MRRINEPLVNFDFAVRSDSNGPIEYGTYNWVSDTGASMNIPYKMVKPYIRVDAQADTPPRLLDGLVGYDGPEIPIPGIEEVVLSFLDSPSYDNYLDLMSENLDTVGARNNAIKKAIQYGDILLFVSALEAAETRTMITQVFVRFYTTLLDIFKAVKHLNPVAAVDVASGIWLEARYGWRPLIGELSNLYKFFTDEKPGPIQKAYGSTGKLAYSFDHHQTVVVDKDGYEFTFDLHLFGASNAGYKTGFTFVNRPGSGNTDAMAKLGVNINSLLSSTYEAVPFSFVLDMFINIGDTLQVLDFENQVDPFNYYKTHWADMEVEVKLLEVRGADTINLYSLPWTGPEYTDIASALTYYSPEYLLNRFVTYMPELNWAVGNPGHAYSAEPPSDLFLGGLEFMQYACFQAYGNRGMWASRASLRDDIANSYSIYYIPQYYDGILGDYPGLTGSTDLQLVKLAIAFRVYRNEYSQESNWLDFSTYYSDQSLLINRLNKAVIELSIDFMSPHVIAGKWWQDQIDAALEDGDEPLATTLYQDWLASGDYRGSLMPTGYLVYSVTDIKDDLHLNTSNFGLKTQLGSTRIVNRQLTDPFTFNTVTKGELSSGQEADLLAIAWKLARSLGKK